MSTDHPSEHRRRQIFPRKAFLIPALLLALMALLPLSTLEVRDVDAQRVLFMTPVSKGETFEIRYIHSVEKVPVAGIFMVSDGNRIEVRESIFSSYGAGLPFDTSREDITFEGGRMRIRHRDVVLDRLRIFVSPFTKQQFIHSGRRVDLSSIREGHIVEIRVRRISLFRCWGRRLWDFLGGRFGQSSG